MSKAHSCVKGFSSPFSKNLLDRTYHAPPRSRICGHASFM